MKKKKIFGTVLAAAIAASATLSGCSLVSSNNRADMEQVIAEVNITSSAAFSESEIGKYGGAVGTTEIIKRDLVAYFLTVGYSYVQSGMSYSDTFKTLVDSLVNNAVLTQYSVMYLLSNKAEESSYDAVMSAYNAYTTDREKYEYILGADSDEVKVAWYSVLSSLNSAIDTEEEKLLTEDDVTSGSASRTTPTNVNTEQDDYYPVLTDENKSEGKFDQGIYYNVYTGYTGYLLSGCGTYQYDRSDLLKNKSTRSTRVKAYNSLIDSLVSNYLVDPEEEDLRDILSLKYVEDEYVAQLEQQIINKYYDLYEEEQAQKIRQGNDEYIEEVYQQILEEQSENYDDAESFTSALGNMSDTSFILYAPNAMGGNDLVEEGTYGFVYNILLPFSTAQTAKLAELQSTYASDEDDGLEYTPEYYTARNALLKNIKTTDQRSAWFNGTTEYAFDATSSGLDYYGSSSWLFFENNLTKTDRYKTLDKYDGRYSYNGTVLKADDDYVLIANELTIDDMLEEFVGYVNYVMGSNVATYETKEDYYKTYTEENLLTAETVGAKKDKEIDYSNFLYATGSVNFGGASEQTNRHNILQKASGETAASEQYKVLSAVNELQYAYTTDTGVLSNYLGYSVATGDETGYIKEFEYAAQWAISQGAGTFAVCSGNYGWHLIYVTYTFNPEGGEQYKPDWSNFDKEGTFEYYFYEWIKSNDIGTISTTRQTQIITKFNDDDTVVKYENRYQNLLDIESES